MQALCHVGNTVTRFNKLTSKYGFQQSERARCSGLFQGQKRLEDDDDDTCNRDIAIPSIFNDDSQTAYEDILHTYQKRLSYMNKFSWAVKDKVRFEELVVQMREMNNGLNPSLPRTRQCLLSRELINGQPNDPTALLEIESVIAKPGDNIDYYNAAVLK